MQGAWVYQLRMLSLSIAAHTTKPNHVFFSDGALRSCLSVCVCVCIILSEHMFVSCRQLESRMRVRDTVQAFGIYFNREALVL